MPETAQQGGDILARWAWVEPTIWTERMLATLETGIEGGKGGYAVSSGAGEAKGMGQRKRSLPMAKYLLLRGGLVLLKTSARCGTIFLKANYQLLNQK